MTQTRQFRLNNMTGGMNTVAEENALITLDPNANLGAGFTQVQAEFRNLDNFMPLRRGGQSKTSGHTLYKALGAGLVTGLHRFIKSDGTNLFLVSHVNTLYKLVGGTLTSLHSSLFTNSFTHFETAYDKCVICDGNNAPLKFDGTTVSALGGSPPSGARQALFYQNRLWMFSNTNNTSLLYYSDPGDIEAGYASNFVNCDVNDGQKITGIAKFFVPGELEPVIIVGKERSVGIVTGSGTTYDPYTFKKISFDVGIAGFRQIVQFGQDAAFLTSRGVDSYKTAIKNINIHSEFLSGKIFDQFSGISHSNLANALCWNDWRNKRISFAVPQGNSQYPNLIWHFDTEQNAWYKQTGFNVTASLVDTDGTVYFGDDSGNIHKGDTTVYSYSASPIVASLQTPYLDFFQPETYKRIKHASIVVRGNGAYSLGISTSLDFGAKTGSSHSVDLTAGSYTWNGNVWTSNAATYQWGGPPLKRRTFFPKGIFRNISFTFNQTGANQPVDIFELNFEVEYLDLY